MGSYCLMGTEFHVGKKEKVLGIDSSDDCTTMWMYLISLNWQAKKSYNDTFYGIYILP